MYGPQLINPTGLVDHFAYLALCLLPHIKLLVPCHGGEVVVVLQDEVGEPGALRGGRMALDRGRGRREIF